MSISVAASLGRPASAARPDDMVQVAGGDFQPFMSLEGSESIYVKPFSLDRFPVTERDYRSFLTANPSWQKEAVSPLFADAHYLSGWEGKPDNHKEADGESAERPVTYVSWYAARAYCASREKRLPRAHEWEKAAAASDRAPDGRRDDRYMRELIATYEHTDPGPPKRVQDSARNFWDVHGTHDLVWEWVEDFNSTMVSRGQDDAFCGAGSLAVPDRQKRDYPAFQRASFRSSLRGNYAIRRLGFRCAKDIDVEQK